MNDAQVRELRAGATRHRVMERVLAVQRHDAMGPLSGVRLALAALGRRAGAGTLSNDDLLARLATIQANVTAVVQALLAMRVWDGARGEAIGEDRLFADCVGWMRPLAMLAQVRIDDAAADNNDSAAAAAPSRAPRDFDDVESVEAHYVVLAAMLHAIDRSAAGGTVTIGPTDDGFRVRWGVGLSPPVEFGDEEPDPPRDLTDYDDDPGRVDSDGVRSLAETCGWHATFGDGFAEVAWR